jgi:hypothetical protein
LCAYPAAKNKLIQLCNCPLIPRFPPFNCSPNLHLPVVPLLVIPHPHPIPP